MEQYLGNVSMKIHAKVRQRLYYKKETRLTIDGRRHS